MKKEKLAISIVIFFISVVLFSLTFIQFRTVEKTNSMGIEEMREDELRQELANWKNKYNEIDEKIKINNEKIAEYGDISLLIDAFQKKKENGGSAEPKGA